MGMGLGMGMGRGRGNSSVVSRAPRGKLVQLGYFMILYCIIFNDISVRESRVE